jgi:hypothetical protein
MLMDCYWWLIWVSIFYYLKFPIKMLSNILIFFMYYAKNRVKNISSKRAVKLK